MAPGNVRGVLAQARRNAEIPGLVELYTVLSGESVTRASRPRLLRRPIRAAAPGFRRGSALPRRGGSHSGGVDPDRTAASLIALWDGIQLQGLLDPDVDVVGCLRDYLESIFVPGAEIPES